MHNLKTDYLVIGEGIAGLSLAIKLSNIGSVTIIAKGQHRDTNTYYAQGGIASVWSDQDDSFAKHIQDTLDAGDGICHESIVKLVVENGPQCISELINYGVQFSSEKAKKASLHLTKEGGHSERRVLHAKDATGKEILETLKAKALAIKNISVIENQFAIDLIVTDKLKPSFHSNYCLGAYVLDQVSQKIYSIQAKQTFLCTGGHGKIYLYTSNPDSATGDGLAMGWRAGCKLANLEFMQFHPTCLFHPEAKNFLISEALRGEGGILKNKKGKPFMMAYHPAQDLAPRDIVARAIDIEIKKAGDDCVYLDVRHLGKEKLKEHFPTIYKKCLSFGIDITEQMIPVVPAAHYSCGGIIVDEFGRTNVMQLFALGETACTGLHGANRLASNSLLEALAFSNQCYEYVQDHLNEHQIPTIEIPEWENGSDTSHDEITVLTHTWDEIRHLMWHYVGIVRSDKRLERALDRIIVIRNEIDKFYWNYQLTDTLLEVRNLSQVAWLTIRSAMMRKESRGIHFNIDYPEHDDVRWKRDTVIW